MRFNRFPDNDVGGDAKRKIYFHFIKFHTIPSLCLRVRSPFTSENHQNRTISVTFLILQMIWFAWLLRVCIGIAFVSVWFGFTQSSFELRSKSRGNEKIDRTISSTSFGCVSNHRPSEWIHSFSTVKWESHIAQTNKQTIAAINDTDIDGFDSNCLVFRSVRSQIQTRNWNW